MALFPNNEDGAQPQDMETVIGKSVKVDGNFHGEGNVRVEGAVQGSIKTSHDLTVGPSAKVKAEVEANNLQLAGEIRGNVKVTERAQLASSARIHGNIETKVLSVEEGAMINGKISMNDGSTASPIPEEEVPNEKVSKKKEASDK